MKTVNSNQLNQVSGGLSNTEVATAAGLSGKTLADCLLGCHQNGGIDITSCAINTAATFVGVYAGFTVYHLLTD